MEYLGWQIHHCLDDISCWACGAQGGISRRYSITTYQRDVTGLPIRDKNVVLGLNADVEDGWGLCLDGYIIAVHGRNFQILTSWQLTYMITARYPA